MRRGVRRASGRHRCIARSLARVTRARCPRPPFAPRVPRETRSEPMADKRVKKSAGRAAKSPAGEPAPKRSAAADAAWLDAWLAERPAVRRAKLGGVDIDGVLRGKYVTLDKL